MSGLEIEPSWFLLYPTVNSQKIETLTEAKKVQIKGFVMIDATWRKARKLLHLYPELTQLPALSFQQSKNSIYHIRKSPNESALSSFEAIIYACEALGAKQTRSMINFMAHAQARLWQRKPTAAIAQHLKRNTE